MSTRGSPEGANGQMTTLIHVTHEALEKMGGIGAVLEGLLTARAYQATVERTVLLGVASLPLTERPPDLETIHYETGAAAAEGVAPELAAAFRRIEAAHRVRLLYGRRQVSGPLDARRALVELVLLDVHDSLREPVDRLKGELWKTFGLPSNRYEKDWGYEEWVRAAAPALEAVEALLGGANEDGVLVSHEFMGLPTLLAARIRAPAMRTVYWAHEVPPVRDLIERRADHRLVFHQALRTLAGQRSYETILRESRGFKSALVRHAHHAHGIFAVSDYVADELRLLGPHFHRTPIEVVYNGLPARPIDLQARLKNREMLSRYAHALVGFRPDYVFTHVARPVASKAIERDMAVLEHLDDLLAEREMTAVLLILASDGGRRSPELVRSMEQQYGWPAHHRLGWPDLVKGEVPIARKAETYNRSARATRAVLINQFGLEGPWCGDRAPPGMTFQDLRQGSDVEFGQSTYEPFGISQLETLAFGGIGVISKVCGCARLLSRVCQGNMPQNVLLADYAAPEGTRPETIGEGDRARIEHQVAAGLAKELAARLPRDRDSLARLLASGWALAEQMSWQAVCRQYFIPALERFLDRANRAP